MLTKITLHNFKCFKELELPLSNLNVFTGLNGMGKSTVLQSMLLLSQSADSIESSNTMRLNGTYHEFGTCSDILYENADDENIEVSYVSDGKTYQYPIQYRADDEIVALKSNSLRPFAQHHLVYLSAYRIAPQKLYNITDEGILSRRDFDKSGEYTIQYLDKFQNSSVENTTILRNVVEDGDNSLAKQVEYWMNAISPGVRPKVTINNSARSAELRYVFKKNLDTTNAYRSTNVGFGITYVLPIIVALLTAKANDIVLLENPEAHIHPKGQRMLGEMIAAACASGAQIILETHSDHILNGIRLAVKKQIIAHNAVNLYYFYQDTNVNDPEKAYAHQIKNPMIDKDGMLNEWPEGFFDEWDNALMELLTP
jgi:predicted ATPase